MKRLNAVGAMLLLLALPAGCATQPVGERAEGTGRAVLSFEEMQAAGYSELHSVIQALRPEWLRSQGATSFRGQEEIQVYLDGNRLGGLAALRDIPSRSVASARFLTGLEATQRWGLSHGMGAIVVSTR
jgi:hypothetical protein